MKLKVITLKYVGHEMHLDTFIMMVKFVSMQTRTSKSFLPLVNYAAMKQEENKNLDFQFVYFKVSEGRFGDPILNFHTERMKEDLSNKAKLACDILKSYK